MHSISHLLGVLGWLCLATVWCVGCGRSGVTFVAVEGLVSCDGEPVANAVVRFMPIPPTLSPGSHGTTDADGHYSLQTEPHYQGAVAGTYKVIISRLWTPNDIAAYPEVQFGAFQETLPSRYSSLSDTELRADITAVSGPINFELTGRSLPSGVR